jgi:hypothetical protein
MKEYYGQRASTPGTLLIAEATFISQQAAEFQNIPGIWSKEKIAPWKQVTDVVMPRAGISLCSSGLWVALQTLVLLRLKESQSRRLAQSV